MDHRAAPNHQNTPVFLNRNAPIDQNAPHGTEVALGARSPFERLFSFAHLFAPGETDVSPPSSKTPCDSRSAVISLLSTVRLHKLTGPAASNATATNLSSPKI